MMLIFWIKSGSGCRQSSHQQLRGWVRISPYVRWWFVVVLWLSARHSVHGSCATPHALPCSAVHVCYVFNNDNTRNLHHYRELFQVCMCSVSMLLVFDIALEVFNFGVVFFEPGLLLSNQYCGEEEWRERKERASEPASLQCRSASVTVCLTGCHSSLYWNESVILRSF